MNPGILPILDWKAVIWIVSPRQIVYSSWGTTGLERNSSIVRLESQPKELIVSKVNVPLWVKFRPFQK